MRLSHTSVLKRYIALTTLVLALASCGQRPATESHAPEAVQQAQFATQGMADTVDTFMGDRKTYNTNGVPWWNNGVGWWDSGIGWWVKGVGWWVKGVPWWVDGEFQPAPDNSAEFKLIGLDRAQARAARLGEGINIAILDNGVDFSHPMLQTKTTSGWDFVGNDRDATDSGSDRNSAYGHGTAVAGLIRQVAPQANLMVYRVLNAEGEGKSKDVAAAIYAAVDQGAHIINLSVSTDQLTDGVAAALRYAVSKKVLLVGSGGNSGGSQPQPPALQLGNDPALDAFGLSVGSVDGKGLQPSWNNKGNEVLAPGVNLFTAYPGGRAVFASGSSFSAPLVSGALALALGEGANPTNLTFNMEGTTSNGIIDINTFLRKVLR